MLNRLAIRNVRRVFTNQVRYHGNRRPDYDFVDQITDVYYSGVILSAITGSSIGMYEAFKSSRDNDIMRNTAETTFGAFGGLTIGFCLGAFWPILLPIGTGVTIMRQLT